MTTETPESFQPWRKAAILGALLFAMIGAGALWCASQQADARRAAEASLRDLSAHVGVLFGQCRAHAADAAKAREDAARTQAADSATRIGAIITETIEREERARTARREERDAASVSSLFDSLVWGPEREQAVTPEAVCARARAAVEEVVSENGAVVVTAGERELLAVGKRVVAVIEATTTVNPVFDGSPLAITIRVAVSKPENLGAPSLAEYADALRADATVRTATAHDVLVTIVGTHGEDPVTIPADTQPYAPADPDELERWNPAHQPHLGSNVPRYRYAVRLAPGAAESPAVVLRVLVDEPRVATWMYWQLRDNPALVAVILAAVAGCAGFWSFRRAVPQEAAKSARGGFSLSRKLPSSSDPVPDKKSAEASKAKPADETNMSGMALRAVVPIIVRPATDRPSNLLELRKRFHSRGTGASRLADAVRSDVLRELLLRVGPPDRSTPETDDETGA